MKKKSLVVLAVLSAIIALIACNETANEKEIPVNDTVKQYGGYASPEEWGEHLVIIGGCHDCHTPKKNDSAWT